MREIQLNEGLSLWLPPAVEQDVELTPEQRRERDHLDAKLDRIPGQPYCWMKTATGCMNKPKRWVREIQYDFKPDSAGLHHPSITTVGTGGDSPGFCSRCTGEAARLAQMVYEQHEAVAWGLKPRRYAVRFDNGDVLGGLTQEFDPNPIYPTVTTEIVRSK